MTLSNTKIYLRRAELALPASGLARQLVLAAALALLPVLPVQAKTAAQVQVSPIAAAAVTPTAELPALVGAASSPSAIKPLPTPAAVNPYGLSAVWSQGDLVARSTLILLALMSLGSWYIIVAKLLEQRRLSQQALQARAAFANAEVSLSKSVGTLTKDSPFRFMVESAFDALRKHKALSHQVDVNTWLSQDIVRSVSNLQMRMQTGLAVLATVGAIAPFVGLFGTVWGIYNALVTIGATGQASIDKVAGPVGESLIMTALGLAVAVPAVLGYNWLVRRNRTALHTVKGFGSDLHTHLLVEVELNQRRKSIAKAASMNHGY